MKNLTNPPQHSAAKAEWPRRTAKCWGVQVTLPFVALLFTLITSAHRVAAAERKPDLFLSANGKDTNPGTQTAPLRSLARAKELVRDKIRAGLTEDLVVSIGGGTYPQSQTLTFGPEDGGNSQFSITYQAAAGEKVILSGGRKIQGWKRSLGPLWTAELPEVRGGTWYPRQLFINDERAIRARTPNQGWCEGKPVQPISQDKTQEPVVICLRVEGQVRAWNHPQDIELAYIRNNDGGRKAIESIDPVNQTVTLRPPHRWAPKCFGFDWYNGVPDGRCYLENAREFLDAPGEWYLDRTTGILTYWPRHGEDLETGEAMVPLLQNTLLAVIGTEENPIQNLHFRGLHIKHVDWPLPDHGYMGLFACNVPVLREGGDPGHRFIDAAVEIAHARSCSFCDGGISEVGAMGLVLREGTADIRIEGNHLRQTGGGGIGLGQCNVAGGYLKAAPPPKPGEYEHFRVRNNYIHHCGADYHGAAGIAAYRMKHSTVSHNLVHDTAYFGICFAGDQDPEWRFMEDNQVERNHIHHAMQVTQDGAGLYVCFAHMGGNNLVRGNLIHDTSDHHASAALYLDSHCTGVKFERNVIYRNPSMTLILNHKDDLKRNAWEANLIFPGGQAAPPQEFIEGMEAYAGLEPRYRSTLLGAAPGPIELRPHEGGRVWQFDSPLQGRGVLYRASSDLDSTIAWRLTPAGLDPNGRYRLRAYAGMPQPTLAHGDARLQFPMIPQATPTPDVGLPREAMGRDLLKQGLEILNRGGATWITYQRAP